MRGFGLRIYDDRGVESINENDLIPKYISGNLYRVNLPESKTLVEYRINAYSPPGYVVFPNVISFPPGVIDDPPVISVYAGKNQLIIMPLPNKAGIVPAGVYTFRVSRVL